MHSRGKGDDLRIYRALILISILLAIDQYTKWVVQQNVQPWRIIRVSSFLNIVNVRNRGMVFGFLQDAKSPWVFWLITLVSLAAAVFVVYLFFKENEFIPRFSLSLIIAGAAGNLINRLTQGSVLDFLDFHWGSHHWPVFNFADACITVGSLILIIYLFLKGGENVSDSV